MIDPTNCWRLEICVYYFTSNRLSWLPHRYLELAHVVSYTILCMLTPLFRLRSVILLLTIVLTSDSGWFYRSENGMAFSCVLKLYAARGVIQIQFLHMHTTYLDDSDGG